MAPTPVNIPICPAKGSTKSKFAFIDCAYDNRQVLSRSADLLSRPSRSAYQDALRADILKLS